MQIATDVQPVPQGQKGSGLKRLAIKLCVSIALAAGLLAGGEAISYVCLPARTPSPASYQAYTHWRMTRVGTAVHTLDADGLRQTSYSHCEGNEYTIWIFGSSGIWGTESDDLHTIPSLVAKQFEESGRRVCVKNYGQNGWVSTQEIIELLLELKRAKKKPEVVIFFDGSEDTFVSYESEEVDVHVGFPRFKQRFEDWRAGEQAGFGYLRSTNTYLALEHLAVRLGLRNMPAAPRSFSPEQLAAMAERTLDNYSKNMEVLDILAAHYGFHCLRYWEPDLLAAQRPLTPSEKLIEEKLERQYPGFPAVKRAAYEKFRTMKRPGFIYLGKLFDDPNETVYVDSTHVKEEGNRAIAERMYEAIQQLGP